MGQCCSGINLWSNAVHQASQYASCINMAQFVSINWHHASIWLSTVHHASKLWLHPVHPQLIDACASDIRHQFVLCIRHQYGSHAVHQVSIWINAMHQASIIVQCCASGINVFLVPSLDMGSTIILLDNVREEVRYRKSGLCEVLTTFTV